MNLDQRTTTRILNIFKEFDKVEKVILFGSRAKGTAKVGSDIDLALVGKGISFKDLCRMGARLEDLDLPNKIDLVEYNSITNPELKFHIERVGIELQSLKLHENTVSESQIESFSPIPRFEGVEMNLQTYLNHKFKEPGYKYEWNNGILEASEKLKFSEQKIINNILNQFQKTGSFQKGDRLMIEVECYLSNINKVKIPDICLLRKYQIDHCDDKTIYQTPEFIIEIISKSNSGNEIASKINDYFSSGVKVVWNIYPELKEVIIFNSHDEIRKCVQSNICEAEEVIPDFRITVNEIF